MNRLYYEEIGLEPCYTDEQLYSQSEVLDPRAEKQENTGTLQETVEKLLE